MPREAFEFVNVQGRMPPVAAEEGELRTSHTLDVRRKKFELVLEADGPPESHTSSTVLSIDG